MVVEEAPERSAGHFCLLHEGGEERVLAVARYIREGLRADERVLFAHDGADPSAEFRALESLGIDPEPFVASGQLVLAPGRTVYLEDGELDPQRMIRRLRAEICRARGDDYTGLRIVGGTEWRQRADVSDALLEFERRGNADLEGLSWTGLCQYRLDRTDPTMVEELLDAHDRTFTSPDRTARIRNLAGPEGRGCVHPVDRIVDVERSRGKDPVAAPESDRSEGPGVGTERELRRAIDRREFVLRYQPIVLLESEEVVGAEALLRWQHPERGLLAPKEFSEAAERAGLLIDIGQLVLDGAVSSLRRWERERTRFESFTLSLNLSPPEYREPDLVDRVRTSLRRKHVEPEHLQFEVGGAVAARTPERLRELQEIGVRLAVDDIVTSHSLERVTDLGADAFRIDRSLVAGLGSGSREDELVESILGLGARRELSIVAEGIDREEQLRRLRRLGCPLGQGYLFARPLPEEEFEELLGARVIGGIGEQTAEWIGDG